MTRTPWLSVLVLVVSILLVSCAGVLYTNYVQHTADARWCELLSTIRDAQKDAPPSPDERINRYRRQIAALHREMGCDP